MTRPLISLLAGLLLTTGCALTKAALDVSLTREEVRTGSLASVPPAQLQLAAFTDSRPNPKRVGYKKNGYGVNMADLVTQQPVPDIVREAVRLTLQKNGHTPGESGPLRIQGDVTQLWFDLQLGAIEAEAMGTAECRLKVEDSATGTLLYEAAYTGHYNGINGGYVATAEYVLNSALARLAESIARDDALTQALSATPPPVAAAPEQPGAP